jgi:hypothetical protein
VRFRRKKEDAVPATSEATIARIAAEHDLEERRADAGRVRAMLREWARIRERNNIAENLQATMRGGHT